MSDSAKLRITSRNEGIDPVVIAFTRGIVTVGEVACAVNGIPAPDRMRLKRDISFKPDSTDRPNTSEYIRSPTRGRIGNRCACKPQLKAYFQGNLHLLSASTTMNTTLLNGASSRGRPSSCSSNFAFPGTNGLCGKKPVAKTKIEMGSRRFGKASRGLKRLEVMLPLVAVISTCHRIRNGMEPPGDC